jgi:hypothetical protein
MRRSLVVLCYALAACKTGGSDAALKDAMSANGAVPTSLQVTVTQASDGSASIADDQGSYDCETALNNGTRQRYICRRDAAQLDLLLDTQSPTLAVFYPNGYASAKAYLKCPSYHPASGQPTTLACQAAPLNANVHGRLVSPFQSTVAGLTLHNAHAVHADDNGRGLVIRGMAPIVQGDYDQLKNYGVKAVLMFKNPEPHMNPTDISVERTTLLAAGYSADAIQDIPFPWKDYTSFSEACRQTVQGLQFLKSNALAGNPVYFHCTVGEDRTGYLAGLYRMLRENLSQQDAFNGEMCIHGYSGGNPNKPYNGVIDAIDGGLTPIFLKMAAKVQSGALTWDNLDPAACNDEPTVNPTGVLCETSVLYQPDAGL